MHYVKFNMKDKCHMLNGLISYIKIMTTSFRQYSAYKNLITPDHRESCNFMKSEESFSMCVWCPHLEQDTHHRVPQDTQVFGTEGNISATK